MQWDPLRWLANEGSDSHRAGAAGRAFVAPSSLKPLAVALSMAWLVLACATGNNGEQDTGPATMSEGGADSGRFDSGPPRDSATDASMTDLCTGVTCVELFERCVAGTCTEYPPCAGDGSCPEGEICHNRHCVPRDEDVDGDGSPAGEDCDETDPARSPLEPEICNLVDDDCDTMVDEGDTTELCRFYPGGGICLMGSCGCPTGTFDLDRDIPGCECVAAPPLAQGLTCETAVDLGDVSDNGAGTTVTATGNVMPDDREVWYRFRAVDTADTMCDNFHVRVRFATNPANTFEFAVRRGACAMMDCADGYDDYSWATDLAATIGGRLTGQCPCWSGTPTVGRAQCTDDGAVYFVRVRRRAGSTLACQAYTLEVTNGVYDTP